MTIKVTARQLEGFAHEVEFDSGHTLVVDEPPDLGGTDTGPSPGRLLAASLAACSAVTIEMYAKRKGWEVGAIEVAVDATYDGHVPTAFEVTVKLPDGLDEEQRQLLLRVAAKCPVHKALSGEMPVTITDKLAQG